MFFLFFFDLLIFLIFFLKKKVFFFDFLFFVVFFWFLIFLDVFFFSKKFHFPRFFSRVFFSFFLLAFLLILFCFFFVFLNKFFAFGQVRGNARRGRSRHRPTEVWAFVMLIFAILKVAIKESVHVYENQLGLVSSSFGDGDLSSPPASNWTNPLMYKNHAPSPSSSPSIHTCHTILRTSLEGREEGEKRERGEGRASPSPLLSLNPLPPLQTQRSSCRGCLFAQRVSMFCAPNHVFKIKQRDERD